MKVNIAMCRFTRLTNAFSNKFENHSHMVALYAVWYNSIGIHKNAQSDARDGVRHYGYEDLVGVVDEWEANQKDKRIKKPVLSFSQYQKTSRLLPRDLLIL
jgi:hypothetical protein